MIYRDTKDASLQKPYNHKESERAY